MEGPGFGRVLRVDAYPKYDTASRPATPPVDVGRING